MIHQSCEAFQMTCDFLLLGGWVELVNLHKQWEGTVGFH